MNAIAALGLLVAGIIHLLPLTGVLGADRLAGLYAVRLDDPNLVILMRHRAVMFGLLGALLVAAAFVPGLRGPALLGGFASVLSFFYLAWVSGEYSPAIARIVYADLIALVGLVAASVVVVLQAKGT